MRIIRLHKRPTPELGTAEGCVKGLLEFSTGQDNCKSPKECVDGGAARFELAPAGLLPCFQLQHSLRVR
jgi:hypothetical protein